MKGWCKRCEEKFERVTRYTKLCSKCCKKTKVDGDIRRRETYRKKLGKIAKAKVIHYCICCRKRITPEKENTKYCYDCREENRFSYRQGYGTGYTKIKSNYQKALEHIKDLEDK